MADFVLKGVTFIFLVWVKVGLVRTVELELESSGRPGITKLKVVEDMDFFHFLEGVSFPLQDFPKQVFPLLQSRQKLEEENSGKL
jgi:hypothetical protein